MATPALSTFAVSTSGNRGGSFRRKWAEKVYEIPHASVETYRTQFQPQDSRSSGAVTVSGGSGDATLTSSAALFASADVGRAITISSIGTYIIASFTSDQSVELATSPAAVITTKAAVITGNTVYAGDSGLYARRLDEWHEEKECPGRPGFARITTRYKVPDSRTLLLEDTSKASVRFIVGGQGQKLEYTRTGTPTIIEGETTTAGGVPIFWRRVKGAPNVFYEPTAQLVISYAAASLALDTSIGVVGKKNAAALTNIGNAAIGTMLVLGFEAEREWDSGALWFIRTHLMYRAAGWTCTSRAYLKATMERLSKKISGGALADSDRMERVVVTIPDPATADVAGLDVTLGTTDLSGINGFCSWVP